MILPTGRREHDPARLAFAAAHGFAASPAPEKLDRTLVDFAPNDYGNMKYGICTFESRTNVARAIAHVNGYELAVDAATPQAGFCACAGIPDTDAALSSADGLQMLDVIVWEQRNGFDIGPQRLVGRYGTVGLDRASIATATARFAAAWVGIRLYESDMDEALSASVWSRDPAGDVVARHATFTWMYSGLSDGSTVALGTWHRWKMATWSWLEARLDEGFGPVFRQLARADGFYAGLTPGGLAAS